MGIPEIGTVIAQAQRAETSGFDGITFTDSQNLVGDPFVAVALAANATERLRFATGVTNAFTRHPAALANVAATVQETSGGRFVLGIGRGDTALFHLGRTPMPVASFVAVFRRSFPSSRSSWRTPASRVYSETISSSTGSEIETSSSSRPDRSRCRGQR